MSTTSRLAIPYPELADGPDGANVPHWMKLLAVALDKAAIYDQGLLVDRPVSTPGSPGIPGRFYRTTDGGVLYLDVGTAWIAVQTPASSINQTGLFAARPAANAVSAGTRYFATDQVAEYISDGAAWTRVSLPAGVTADWFKPDATVPAGWVKYDGTNLPATTGIYADLYAHLGNTLTTPDTRGRMIVGQGTHLDIDTIGENEGLAAGARRPKHKHLHTLIASVTYYRSNGAAPGDLPGKNTDVDTLNTYEHAVTGGIGPQTGNEPADTPAYIVALKIAKL